MSRRGRGEGSIYRRADGRWEATSFRQTESGTRRRISVYGKTRDEAHAKLLRSLNHDRAGLIVPDRAWRLDAYLDHWLPTVKTSCSPMTFVLYESVCRVHLKPGLGSRPLSALTAPELQRFFNEQLTGHSVRSVQKMRTVLSSALTQAWRQQLISINPARRVVLPSYQRADIAPWSVDQLRRFLDTATTDALYPALLLLCFYGLRRGEVLGLRWRDIDFDNRVIHIRQQVQRYEGRIQSTALKTRASRRDLPLIDQVARALIHHGNSQALDVPADDLLFVAGFGNPLEPGNLTRVFNRLTRAAGLPRIKMHHLRHTAATLLKDLGVPPRDVQAILGHASVITTLQLYQHADLSGQLSALTKLERSLRTPRRISRQGLPSTGVVDPDGFRLVSGGSSQTRTGDTRLFRSTLDRGKDSLTEVKLLARARYLTAVIGGAAVMFCRQSDTPALP